MGACHVFEQGDVQRDVTANPKRMPFNTPSRVRAPTAPVWLGSGVRAGLRCQRARWHHPACVYL
jgi:hypothetical protein